MAEISDWSPIDDDNNMAPPVGWPEGMMPSAVNNTARGMMGTLRRMYDSIVSGVQALPYLPLAGGTVTGNVAVNGTGGVQLSGVSLRNISSGLEVTHPAGGGIMTRGPGAGLGFGDRDQASPGWLWYAQSGVAGLWNGANRISVDAVGNTNVGGNFGSPGNITANGQVAGSLVTSSGGITAAGNIAAPTGSVTASLLQSTGNITTTTGQVSGALLTSTGGITAAGNIAAPTITGNLLQSNGNIAAAGGISGTNITATSLVSGNIVGSTEYDLRGHEFAAMDAGATFVRLSDPGGQNMLLFASGNNYYDNVQHFFRSRGGVSTYAFFHGGGTFNVSGSWNVISDDTVKTNVTPYTAGLAEIRQLNPVSFEYTSGAALRGAEGTVNYGLMASEVQPVLPEMVAEAMLDVDGVPTPTQTLTPTHLTYVLITACKELATQNEALAARVAALEGAR